MKHQDFRSRDAIVIKHSRFFFFFFVLDTRASYRLRPTSRAFAFLLLVQTFPPTTQLASSLHSNLNGTWTNWLFRFRADTNDEKWNSLVSQM